MVRTKHVLTIICCLAVLWLEGNMPAVAWAEVTESDQQVRAPAIEPLQVPATALADTELLLRFGCGEKTQVAWQAIVARRPFASGVVQAKNGQLEIRLRTPEVKEAVVLPIEVVLEGVVCKIHVFARNPLPARRQWAENLELALFDPSGNTATALDEIDLPYRRVTGLGALAAVTQGVVVVGEGLPLDEHRGLDDVLCQLARRGMPVIVLAPESGRLAIGDPAPRRFELRDAEAGPLIDSRTAADLTRSRGYRISAHDGCPALSIADAASSYAWGDFRFDLERGRLCCLAWNLLDRWETSPAPRFFLIRLLEIIASGKDLPGGKNDD